MTMSTSAPLPSATPGFSSSPPAASAPSSSSSPSASFSPDVHFFGCVLSADRGDFQYVNELTASSLSRLEKEPNRLADDLKRLDRDIDQLSISNYRLFIDSASALSSTSSSLQKMESALSRASSQLFPQLFHSVEKFSQVAAPLFSSLAVCKTMFERCNELSDLLEMPNLMEQCVRMELYEEALEIEAHAHQMLKKHKNIQILKKIVDSMSSTKKVLLSRLLSVLSGPLTLSQCLRYVSFLRRLDYFSERSLRLCFLQCRDHYLAGLLGELNRAHPHHTNPYEFASKYLDVIRLNLFEIITQYKAIFAENDRDAGELKAEEMKTVADGVNENGNGNVDGPFARADVVSTETALVGDRSLLSAWLHRRVSLLLSMLRSTLPLLREGSLLLNLLDQSMYLGASLARIGCDFRPLLSSVFESGVLQIFAQHMKEAMNAFQLALQQYEWYYSSAALMQFGFGAELTTPSSSYSSSYSLQSGLLHFPPLAVLSNHFIASFNKIRSCSPVILSAEILNSVVEVMQNLAEKIAALDVTAVMKDEERRAKQRTLKTETPSNRRQKSDGENGLSAADGAPSPAVDTDELDRRFDGDPLGRLAFAFNDYFVPFILSLFHSIYPQSPAEKSAEETLEKIKRKLTVLYENKAQASTAAIVAPTPIAAAQPAANASSRATTLADLPEVSSPGTAETEATSPKNI